MVEMSTGLFILMIILVVIGAIVAAGLITFFLTKRFLKNNYVKTHQLTKRCFVWCLIKWVEKQAKLKFVKSCVQCKMPKIINLHYTNSLCQNNDFFIPIKVNLKC